ncbi:hypothetical protein CERSUDRAFT_97729 [Gelatoporia subvermispora B]|uniref:Uncharacterized protein n=1 Tax=Ceriporiopsis subvermispora (strain B) TaxID=914234 RepID=M2PF10_CERS8|nr:hypothetical protein CERSUDRAFT_97729 [Gelatoporia subvermispora B]
MDELFARFEFTQFKIDDVGICALWGIEANSAYAIVWVDKEQGGVVDGILCKGMYMLHLMVAAHDPTHWTSLIIHGPDIILAKYDKHPGARGPLWITRE